MDHTVSDAITEQLQAHPVVEELDRTAGPGMAATAASLLSTEFDLSALARRVVRSADYVAGHTPGSSSLWDCAATELGAWQALTGLDRTASVNLARLIVMDPGTVRAVVRPF